MDKIIIYSDGACSNNQSEKNFGGYGAVLIYKDNVKKVYGGEINTTNNVMELTAIIKALEMLKRKDIPVEVYSDSAYIVNCINNKWYVNWRKNGWKTSKKTPVENKQLWEKLLLQIESLKIFNIIKVKGHAGDTYNEMADELARRGADEVK
ncbi:ribonuclease HI [Sedimentibacter sp. zth1]|uniref:ribonuclease HI n=1 Tax=Sedimentibacter sp. zth1 TaxID=2816908 RepID=UPI001A90DCBB|nr:ribonuclease HI [Sedimentibacter sp. zth1]QSX06893.1 ribonuclease HI [Sedimentibacter sp. zth1]